MQVVGLRKKLLNHTEGKVEEKDIHVKTLFDYPTIEGMVYADTILKVSIEDFNSKQYSEKVKCLNDVGKIIWVPRKLLEEIK